MKKVLITYKLSPEIAKELDGKMEYVLPDKSGFKREEVLDMIADFDVLVPNFSFYTDKEIMALPRGWAVRFAKTAARFRKELIKTYGKKRGKQIRFAEAYQVCEYGSPMTEEIRKILEEV